MAPRSSRSSSTDPLDQIDDSSTAPTREREQLKHLDSDTSPSNPGVVPDPLIDTTQGGWVIEGVLGRGASGIVYRAQQLTTRKRAAFKVLKPEFAEEPEYIRRLIEEAKALSALRHPGIIGILDFGALANGQPYLVMELCDGLSLEEQLKFGGKPTLRESLGLLDELLGALTAAHDNGIIHRDVKPSNLFLATNDDGTQSIKVLDFGLARLGDRRSSRNATRPGAIIGTPDYMAPEQITGKEVGGWTDVYATGSIAFRLLTGQLPFNGPTGIAVISMKMDKDPPRPREVDPRVPAELDALIHEMMARDAQARPSTRLARARVAAYLKSLDRGPRPSLIDDEESSRPTTFHQFDDRAAARQAMAKTERVPDAPPGLVRRTDLVPHLASTPKTDLEQALEVPAQAARGQSRWVRSAGLVLFGLGAGSALAWWVMRQ